MALFTSEQKHQHFAYLDAFCISKMSRSSHDFKIVHAAERNVVQLADHLIEHYFLFKYEQSFIYIFRLRIVDYENVSNFFTKLLLWPKIQVH